MVIIVNFIVHFAGGPYGKLMEKMVSFIINIFNPIANGGGGAFWPVPSDWQPEL